MTQQETWQWTEVFAESPGQVDVYWKSCQWSPDGSALLASDSSHSLSLLQITDDESIAPLMNWTLPECVYATTWYPLMTKLDPLTCCFLSAVRDQPLTLWDASPSGSARAQYVARDHVELVVAPNAITFSLDGSKIYAGFNNRLTIFDTSVPGSTCDSFLLTPSKRSKNGLKGLVSDISYNPDNSQMFAVGTFAGNVGLFDERNNDLLEVRQVKGGGVSQVKFTRDGTRLVTASRNANEIQVWDLRQSGKVLFTLPQKASTPQRLYFDFDPSGKYILSGDIDGCISFYDLDATADNKLAFKQAFHSDVCSSSMFHPYLPRLATTSGSRRPEMRLGLEEDEDTDLTIPVSSQESRLCIWKLSVNSST